MLMYGNSGLDLGRPRGAVTRLIPKRGCIWTARDPASSKTPSPGLGEGGAPCHSDLRGQNPGFEPEPTCTFFAENVKKCTRFPLRAGTQRALRCSSSGTMR